LDDEADGDGVKLVSAILPTRGRQEWARQAVECFLGQTYPLKELIIVDDEDLSSFEQCPLGVRYERNTTRYSVGEKRNRCCALAQGEIVCHFDSDDWSHPERIADQVGRLEETGKAVTGYSSILFYDHRVPMWGRYVYTDSPPYALGTSLCYLKSWWLDHPFTDSLIGEDNNFIAAANQANQFTSVEGLRMMVARVHESNISPKDIGDYRPITPEMIPAGYPA
jgi:O-antigen biosynthesis protein